MDWGFVMGVITGILLVAYLCVFVWAFRQERKKAFEEASRYPFFDEQVRL